MSSLPTSHMPPLLIERSSWPESLTVCAFASPLGLFHRPPTAPRPRKTFVDLLCLLWLFALRLLEERRRILPFGLIHQAKISTTSQKRKLVSYLIPCVLGHLPVWQVLDPRSLVALPFDVKQ